MKLTLLATLKVKAETAVSSLSRDKTKSLFITIETLTLISVFWQTRYSLVQLWPQQFAPPAFTDYLLPYIYLNQVLFILTIALWLLLYRPYLWSNFQRVVDQITKRNPLSFPTLPKLLAILTKPLFWASLALLFTTISLIINHPHWWNIFKYLTLIEGIIVTIYLYFRLKQGQLQRFAFILLLSIIFQQLLIIAQWINQGTLGLQWLGEWSANIFTPGAGKVVIRGQEYFRPLGTFPHANVIAGLITISFLPLWHSLKNLPTITINFKKQQGIALTTRHYRSLWLLLTILSLTLTFSRTAWLIFTTTLVLLITQHLISSKAPQNRNYYQTLKSSLTSKKQALTHITLSLTLIILTTTLVIPRLNSLFSYDRISYDRRVELNQLALDHIQAYPWWGIGQSNFILSTFQYGPLHQVGLWRQPAHNIYLLSAAEIGLPATLAWITAVITLLYQISQNHQLSSSSKLTLIWIWLTWLLIGLVDHYWLTLHQSQYTLWIILAITIHLTPQSKRATNNRHERRGTSNG